MCATGVDVFKAKTLYGGKALVIMSAPPVLLVLRMCHTVTVIERTMKTWMVVLTKDFVSPSHLALAILR